MGFIKIFEFESFEGDEDMYFFGIVTSTIS
jgi:hypothetical protein